jgi:hypothetical protein
MMKKRGYSERVFRACLRVVLLVALLVLEAPQSLAQNVDVSDSLWSIILPTEAAANVDMGRVLVGSSRDSVVAAFLTNTGTVPVRIDSLYFTGPDAGLFSVKSALPPYTLQVGVPQPVEFHFVCPSLGVKTATIVIHAQADTITATITGEGVIPKIEVTTPMVNFGALTVNEKRDTTITSVIRNIGSAPLNVSATGHLGPDTSQFIIISGGGAFTLAPGESHPMQLRFAPVRVGSTSGRIGFDHDAAGSPATVDLFGEGLPITGSATLWIDTIRAKIGDTVEVAIRMRDTVKVREAGTTRISTELRFRSSLLAPLPGTPRGVQANRVRTILLDSLPVATDAEGVLARLHFIATLGDSAGTSLELHNTVAVGGMVTMKEIPGYFGLTNICLEGGARLYDAGGRVSLFQNRPNPFNAQTVIDYQVIEEGPTQLFVMDLMGRTISTLVQGSMPRGRHTVSFDASSLPSGTYVLVMQTPSNRISRFMEILK